MDVSEHLPSPRPYAQSPCFRFSRQNALPGPDPIPCGKGCSQQLWLLPCGLISHERTWGQRRGFPQKTRRATMCDERTGQGGTDHALTTFFSVWIATKNLPRFFTSRTLKRAAWCVHTAAASG